MNFLEILNTVVSGILTSLGVALLAFLWKLIKNNYNKDSCMFWLNFSFYFSICALVISSTFLNFKDLTLYTPSFHYFSNFSYLIDTIVNIFNLIVSYRNTKKYVYYCGKYSNPINNK